MSTVRRRSHGIRFMGPNCLGLIRPSLGLNATFGNNSAAEGGIALVSQSGALCTSFLDWAENRDVGFSAVVSFAPRNPRLFTEHVPPFLSV